MSAWAHARGVRLLRYLDDWLVLASTEARARQHVRDLLSLCNSLGVVLNREKSDLNPSQSVEYLGMTIDTVAARAYPTLPRIDKFIATARKIPSVSGSSCPALAGVVGTHVIVGEAGSPRKTQNALTPMASEVALVPREGPSQPPGTPVPAGRGRPLLVDGKGPPTRGDTLWNPNPGPPPILGCVPSGLGSSPPRTIGVGSMVTPGELVTHQSPGVKGPFPGTPCVQASSHRPPSDSDARQFDCGRLCEQTGGHGLRLPLLVDRATSPMDGIQQSPTGSKIPARTVQRPGGPAQSLQPGPGCRVVAPPAGGKGPTAQVGVPHD